MPTPKLIIHGGAGAITRHNLSPEAWAGYSTNLSRIYRSTAALLEKGGSALDAATHAVALFEDCELFNCGKGAVFTRDGTIELEASIMVTHPYKKRYCAAALLRHVKNPIKFVREMLVRGEHDGSGGGNSGGDGDPAGGSGGAQGHCCLSGEGAERLAREWGLEMVDPKYFWTRKRWEQHRKGLGRSAEQASGKDECASTEARTSDCSLPNDHNNNDDNGPGWDGIEYLPQGTVGCVALDRDGAICVATSTGGLTNKLAGRIGDTPTVGAGFWAEEWISCPPVLPHHQQQLTRSTARAPMMTTVIDTVASIQSCLLGDCLSLSKERSSDQKGYHYISNDDDYDYDDKGKRPTSQLRAVALSGTGNGDSFLRLSACRTAGAIVRFSPPPPDGLIPIRTLASAVNQIAGPAGELQRSAGDRWGKTGEGEAGMIGIDYIDDGGGGKGGDGAHGEAHGEVVFDFNCGGMFRCWVDAEGRERVMVFRDEY